MHGATREETSEFANVWKFSKTDPAAGDAFQLIAKFDRLEGRREAFLESGDEDKFWSILAENRLSKEDFENARETVEAARIEAEAEKEKPFGGRLETYTVESAAQQEEKAA